MNLNEYQVLNEYPIITDSIGVEVSSDFFTEEKRNGIMTPSMKIKSIISENKDILLLKITVDSLATTQDKEYIYSIRYGVRVGFQFDKELPDTILKDKEFIQFYADKVYQRIADRINHIGFDMGVVITMPMTRPEIQFQN